MDKIKSWKGKKGSDEVEIDTEPAPVVRTCVNCRWSFIRIGSSSLQYRVSCHHANNMRYFTPAHDKMNNVTGAIEHIEENSLVENEYASTCRDMDWLCGDVGKWFEPKTEVKE